MNKNENLRMRTTAEFKEKLQYLAKVYRLNGMSKVIEKLVDEEYYRIKSKYSK